MNVFLFDKNNITKLGIVYNDDWCNSDKNVDT